jgi:hypothetical protein
MESSRIEPRRTRALSKHVRGTDDDDTPAVGQAQLLGCRCNAIQECVGPVDLT